MEKADYNLHDIDLSRKQLGDFYKKQQEIKDNLREDNIKISLLNIDSNYRSKEPKNIYETSSGFLQKDPIYTKEGSNEIKIIYPNHNLSIGDLIIISDVKSIDSVLSNSFFLYNGFDYLIIKIKDHNIPINYKEYIDEIKVDINFSTPINTTSDPNTQFYGTIPINMIIGPKVISTLQDVSNDSTLQVSQESITNLINDILTETDIPTNNSYDVLFNTIYKDFLFVKLDFNFIYKEAGLFKIEDTYNIKFMDLNGIPLYYINADYPINYDRRQGYHEIISIDNESIWIEVKSKSYVNGFLGGSNVSIFKIIKTISGYPNAGEFTINLRNNFTNVVRIEMISSEFPFTDLVVKENVNNKLYWQHLDDGDKVYSISISSGNYSASNLIETISTKMNAVERINSSPENQILNKFEIKLNTFTNKITFSAFSETILPNSITEGKISIEGKEYYKLDIKHPNNFVKKNDLITISNSEAIGEIPKSAINTTHKVFDINITDQTYSIILVPFNTITSSSSNQKGGSSIKIKTAARVRFLFNFDDTLGDVLGFKNVGTNKSITNFNSEITNLDNYAYSNNLNSVGNIDLVSNVLQLTGKDNYWLLYLNNFESVILNNGLNSCFAKILLTGTQGDIIYNSFVNSPIEFDIPVPTISDISIKVTNSRGEIVDFENTDFSFTIRIFELIAKPKGTGKFSNNISYIQEISESIKKKDLKT